MIEKPLIARELIGGFRAIQPFAILCGSRCRFSIHFEIEFFDHKGVAVIRNGKLTRLREPRADSRRDSAEINLQQLILQLLTFKPAKGEGKA